MSTSLNGLAWSPVTRVPIDPTTSTVDHFIPGLGVDKATSGSSAHLALTYYYYPNASCTSSSCRLHVGFISSTNGGTTWSPVQQLAGPMPLNWLASTSQGAMVGDYISTSFSGGRAFPVVALANAPSNGTFDEAMYTFAGGLAVSGGATSGAESGGDGCCRAVGVDAHDALLTAAPAVLRRAASPPATPPPSPAHDRSWRAHHALLRAKEGVPDVAPGAWLVLPRPPTQHGSTFALLEGPVFAPVEPRARAMRSCVRVVTWSRLELDDGPEARLAERADPAG